MAGSSRKLSFIEFYGDQEDNKCGYCHQTSGSFTQSMWAHQLTAADYQALIDRGWRRSGKYCYKPRMDRTCCPSYTIRCDAEQFRLSKSQRKCIRNVQRCLERGLSTDCRAEEPGNGDGGGGCPEMRAANYERGPEPGRDMTVDGGLDELLEQTTETRPAETTDTGREPAAPESKKSKLAEAGTSNRTVASGDGRDTAKPLQKKAKLLRLERRAAKLQAVGGDGAAAAAAGGAPAELAASAKEATKSLAELLTITESATPPKHRLTLRLLRADESLESTPELLPLYQKYQHRVHGDNPAELRLSSFRRFLVDSPLAAELGAEAPACGFGTFHQQYWLDGERLVAVAVLDILPRCVSAVYFFYDPDVREMSLGTYSSFCELELVQRLRRECESLRYYYMGYYIQSCAKMRYKANVRPSQLLCPEVYTWHAIEEELTDRLEATKYQRLNQDAEARDTDEFRLIPDLNNVLMVHQRKLATYAQVCAKTTRTGGKVNNNNKLVREMFDYGQIVGRALSTRMVFTTTSV